MTRRRRRVPPPGASPSHSESPGHQDGKGRGVTSPKAAGASAPVFKSFAQPPHKFHLEKGRYIRFCFSFDYFDIQTCHRPCGGTHNSSPHRPQVDAIGGNRKEFGAHHCEGAAPILFKVI